MNATKNCRICQTEKPLSEYNVKKSNKDGLRNACRPCQRNSNAEYRKTPEGRLVRAFHQAKGSAKRNGVFDDLTMDELREAYRVSKARGCPYCGEEIEDNSFSLDHVIPMSKHGPNTFANIVICHHLCNTNKHNRPVTDYATEESLDVLMRDTFMRSEKKMKVWEIVDMFQSGEYKKSN
ncbi:HNH endonuclease [Halobacillus naozhouensis]|uniref:HNH endonuclease n=1 Tax=Halobacillus naozhouensis TaxID=554880 RepID=A0ABY8IYI7_9BACI|nr:HNH endonuclease [Halobacillus naozhouensis]WFT74887.1 HNH endonuclease [Halobacillus naozhouensis]